MHHLQALHDRAMLGAAMHAFRSRSTIVRFSWSEAQGSEFFPSGLARPVRLLCAVAPARCPIPVMVVDAGAREAWVMGRGTRAITDSLVPPVRAASVGVALALAAGSLILPPLAVVALAYAAYRAAERELQRHTIHCRLESHLRLSLPRALAGA